MKKLAAGLLAALISLCVLAAPRGALASNCSPNPYTLTNNTLADATQVMANFNNLLTCLNSSMAHNGANSDITSLTGLTTPLSIGQGGTGATTASGALTSLGALAAANNLSDLASASTARSNLGVPTGTSGAVLCFLNTSCTWTAQVIGGHLTFSGTAPTVSSCGTGASLVGNSTDSSGEISVGSGTVTSCVLTFNSAFSGTPFCTVSAVFYNGTFSLGPVSSSAITITSSTNMAGVGIMYRC